MMPLIFKQILDTKDIDYDDAILIYQEAFPSSERQPLSKIRERITAGKSQLFVGIMDEEVICMALLWDFNNTDFTLLDYMAVAEKHRNNHFGSKLFNFLVDKVISNHKFLLLEVENYLFGNNREQRKKRVNFYLKNGSYLLDNVPYVLPSLDNSLPLEALLMIAPKYKSAHLKKSEIENLIKRMYQEIYEKSENDELLVSVLKKIPNKISLVNKRIL
ncbi:MAG TPA: GNAT family N-acetyltransferase [Lutibacter sp.]|nr:GNAT family N-acetyltransferase [Lutibacter sp.]